MVSLNKIIILPGIFFNGIYFKIYFMTGLGPDYIISGPWPELTVLASSFRQEAPSLLIINNGDHPVS